MDLEWMQKHRALVGKMIRFANALYSYVYPPCADGHRY